MPGAEVRDGNTRLVGLKQRQYGRRIRAARTRVTVEALAAGESTFN
jgi:hypothetical protein